MDASRRLVFFGDSLTAGYGLDPARAFPAEVGRLLTAQGLDVVAINAGLSGETTAAGLRRIDWILRQPADVILIGLGGNDFLRGLPAEDSKANLRAMIQKVKDRQPQAMIVLMGMQAPPNLGDAYANAFAAVYPSLAAEQDVALYPFLLEGVGGNPEMNLADGIHPNAEGHKVIAARLAVFLKDLLADHE